ncbi:hypothetical protein GCM10009530_48310 [Microbispora corallina]|uniref:Uncharacterized protein n=1 Tax=Microbispora corallina TaxID=83302 RepID=A0ABQ4G5Q2_9ACTN|nr:hypothetical protein [Microbispora corallina]GIH42407.1 hypothetical protein Mco01_54070 [Microbispora corallina]
MTDAEKTRRPVGKPNELRDVYEFLEEVRLRPGMWARGSSLQHLDSMLIGYRVASEIHGIGEPFDFFNGGPFAEWLWKRLGMSYGSTLGWAVEIERAAEKSGTPPMEMFFALLDELIPRRTQLTPSLCVGPQLMLDASAPPEALHDHDMATDSNSAGTGHRVARGHFRSGHEERVDM